MATHSIRMIASRRQTRTRSTAMYIGFSLCLSALALLLLEWCGVIVPLLADLRIPLDMVGLSLLLGSITYRDRVTS